MRVLLTHGYFLAEDAKEAQIMRPYPPMGILYLSAYLRSRGYDPEVYDSTFGSREELFDLLERGERGLLGVYANLLTRPSVVGIIERARALGWRVAAGGPEPSNYVDQYLEAGAHWVVPGEGELVLEHLVAGDPAPNGVAYLENGRVVRTPPMPQIRDLDSLPWPDRDCIDLNRYLRVWRERHGMGSVSLITARGCPYRCRWCSHSTYGNTHRRRSPRAVADEVAWIARRYSPEMLWYADDVFTIHHGWLFDYAAEMKRRGLRIPFECITRADRVTDRVAETLAQLGCMRVWIGSESGSQRILDGMDRGVKTSQVEAALHAAKAQGIQTGMFLMWGYEGEEAGDIETTVEHVRTCAPDVFLTTVSYPIKGTPYHSEVAQRLVQLKDWRSGTDRDVAIRGRHSRRFYSFADDLLRASTAPVPDPAAMADARRGMAEAYAEVEA
jgi:radical SAM superfamily enzyme YgiQ (UPF0313 family)